MVRTKKLSWRSPRVVLWAALIAVSGGLLRSHVASAETPEVNAGEEMPLSSLEGSMLYWVRLREALKPWVIAPVQVKEDGRIRALPLESVSPNLTVEPGIAEWSVGDTRFRASLTESGDSDGGDLWDLLIEEQKLESSIWVVTARAQAVPAFGDVLLGLFGGRTDGLQRPQVR
jgi:hypothetical protein